MGREIRNKTETRLFWKGNRSPLTTSACASGIVSSSDSRLLKAFMDMNGRRQHEQRREKTRRTPQHSGLLYLVHTSYRLMLLSLLQVARHSPSLLTASP